MSATAEVDLDRFGSFGPDDSRILRIFSSFISYRFTGLVLKMLMFVDVLQ